MSLSNRLHQTPAVSLSADGGHGSHCYTWDSHYGISLVCGWPERHTNDHSWQLTAHLDGTVTVDRAESYMDKLRSMRQEGDTE